MEKCVVDKPRHEMSVDKFKKQKSINRANSIKREIKSPAFGKAAISPHAQSVKAKSITQQGLLQVWLVGGRSQNNG